MDPVRSPTKSASAVTRSSEADLLKKKKKVKTLKVKALKEQKASKKGSAKPPKPPTAPDPGTVVERRSLSNRRTPPPLSEPPIELLDSPPRDVLGSPIDIEGVHRHQDSELVSSDAHLPPCSSPSRSPSPIDTGRRSRSPYRERPILQSGRSRSPRRRSSPRHRSLSHRRDRSRSPRPPYPRDRSPRDYPPRQLSWDERQLRYLYGAYPPPAAMPWLTPAGFSDWDRYSRRSRSPQRSRQHRSRSPFRPREPPSATVSWPPDTDYEPDRRGDADRPLASPAAQPSALPSNDRVLVEPHQDPHTFNPSSSTSSEASDSDHESIPMDTSPKQAASRALRDYLKSQETAAQSVLKADHNLTQKEKEAEVERARAQAAKQEAELHGKLREEILKMADEKEKSFEEHKRQLLAKMEEDRKNQQLEYERMLSIKLQMMLESKLRDLCSCNTQASLDRCQALLTQLFQDLEKKIASGIYAGCQQFLNDQEEQLEKYQRAPGKGLKASRALRDYLKSQETAAQSVLKADHNLTQKEKEAEVERARAQAAEQEAELHRKLREEILKMAEEKEKSYEEHKRQLLAKMEEDRKNQQLQYKRMLSIKLQMMLESKLWDLCSCNTQASLDRCQALLTQLFQDLEKKIASGIYAGCQQFLNDLKERLGKYQRAPGKGLKASRIRYRDRQMLTLSGSGAVETVMSSLVILALDTPHLRSTCLMMSLWASLPIEAHRLSAAHHNHMEAHRLSAVHHNRMEAHRLSTVHHNRMEAHHLSAAHHYHIEASQLTPTDSWIRRIIRRGYVIESHHLLSVPCFHGNPMDRS
ncbi:UNVERIFIED_CONTAM: hypothetical protein K2H54_030381 [Gekko kuhli]